MQGTVGYRLYWLGRSFARLPLTAVLRDQTSTSFIYGDCHASGESGCSTPLEIQVWSICARNALLIDGRAQANFVARGVPVLDWGDDLEVATADADVVLFARPALARRAISALRPLGGTRTRTLEPPRYPRYYLAQLRRVRDAYGHARSAREVRDKLGISASEVRFQLALAYGLAAMRLRRAGQAPALQDVKRDLLAATLSDEQGQHPANPLATAARAERGRRLRSRCALEKAPR